MYKRLNAKLGDNKILKLDKTCNRMQQDIFSIRYIKDTGDHENDIKARWDI